MISFTECSITQLVDLAGRSDAETSHPLFADDVDVQRRQRWPSRDRRKKSRVDQERETVTKIHNGPLGMGPRRLEIVFDISRHSVESAGNQQVKNRKVDEKKYNASTRGAIVEADSGNKAAVPMAIECRAPGGWGRMAGKSLFRTRVRMCDGGRGAP
jgi:hypothetical protein